jgi:hypothetical protein
MALVFSWQTYMGRLICIIVLYLTIADRRAGKEAMEIDSRDTYF